MLCFRIDLVLMLMSLVRTRLKCQYIRIDLLISIEYVIFIQ